MAAIQAVLGLGVAVVGNTEGVVGGVLYIALFAVPMTLVAMGVNSPRAGRRTLAAWAALILAVLYVAIIAINWSGYTFPMIAVALSATVPTSLMYLLVFLLVVVLGDKGIKA